MAARGVRSAITGAAVALLILIAGFVLIRGWVSGSVAPEPETIAAASLQGLREQNKLSAFAARYVAVVTSRQRRLGVLSAEKTLILPGLVRYEVDLGKLSERDLDWNPVDKRLTVTLPPIELVGPQVDMNAIQEYDGGGVLLALTDAEKALDAANRRAAQAELLKQARGPVPMRLARDATRRAVERSFALPLRAAGLDATVEVRFADERRSTEQMDRSRSLDEVFAE